SSPSTPARRQPSWKVWSGRPRSRRSSTNQCLTGSPACAGHAELRRAPVLDRLAVERARGLARPHAGARRRRSRLDVIDEEIDRIQTVLDRVAGAERLLGREAGLPRLLEHDADGGAPREAA